MKIPFISAAPGPEGRYPINLYFDPEQEDGRPALVGTPGLLEYLDLSNYAEVRGLHKMGDYLYAVCGATLYKINTTPTATSLGTLNTSTGPVWMAQNGTQIMISDGADGYTYNASTGTFAQISDADFPGSGTVTFQDGYLIINDPDTQKFYISALYDGTSWDALDYASAEGDPDDIVAVIMDHRELWIFGEETIEIFQNTGATDFPFERIPGGFLECGLESAASVAALDNSLFWLADDLTVRRAINYSPQIVSTPEINHQIAGYSRTDDAIGFGYTQKGHPFYVLNFPTAQKTWVYDALASAAVKQPVWHQRESYPVDALGNYSQWRANCYVYYNHKHIVGDFENGKLYELKTDTYTDDGETIKRQRTAPPVHADRKLIFFSRFEIEFEPGVGLITGQGTDPQAMHDWSDDYGNTWSNEHWTTIGKIGEYDTRAVWRRLGRSRNRTPRLTITDPVKVVIKGAFLDAKIGV